MLYFIIRRTDDHADAIRQLTDEVRGMRLNLEALARRRVAGPQRAAQLRRNVVSN